jgi:hypothetical protein
VPRPKRITGEFKRRLVAAYDAASEDIPQDLVNEFGLQAVSVDDARVRQRSSNLRTALQRIEITEKGAILLAKKNVWNHLRTRLVECAESLGLSTKYVQKGKTIEKSKTELIRDIAIHQFKNQNWMRYRNPDLFLGQTAVADTQEDDLKMLGVLRMLQLYPRAVDRQVSTNRDQLRVGGEAKLRLTHGQIAVLHPNDHDTIKALRATTYHGKPCLSYDIRGLPSTLENWRLNAKTVLKFFCTRVLNTRNPDFALANRVRFNEYIVPDINFATAH